MHKTLLLVFVHGFKGGDDTFGTFPDHVKALISHALPKISVVTLQYPQFETRGELKECVTRFREWLENKVIDLEVANNTPSPTIDPSVHTILVGHSMGGIVAAETLLLLASERPISPSSSAHNADTPNFPSNTTLHSSTGTSHPNPRIDPSTPPFMFPHVQAVIAFDTPYLGLAPEMVAHSLEGGHKVVSSAWDSANEVASIFGWGSKAPTKPAGTNPSMSKSVGALPAPPVVDAAADAAATPRWQAWGKYAMFAGAAGAVAAGGAAALYSQRERISAGWSWATSHLLFVGDLAKAEVLKQRVERMEQTVTERSLGGCANFYTNLGRGAREGYGITESVAGKERTFCNLPVSVKDGKHDGLAAITSGRKKKDGAARGKLTWIKAVNDKAKDETAAHMSMFFPKDNPGFYSLGERTVEVVSNFIDEGWYESSEGPGSALSAQPSVKDKQKGKPAAASATATAQSSFTVGSLGKDWEGVNNQDVHGGNSDDEDVKMRDEDREEDQDMLEDSVIIENTRSSAANLGQSKTSPNAKSGVKSSTGGKGQEEEVQIQ